MRAGEDNIVIEQGSTLRVGWSFNIGIIPQDFTGYTARMQVRTKPRRDATLMYTFTSEENSGSIIPLIVFTGGEVSITFGAAWSEDKEPDKGYFDLRLATAGGEVEFAIRGEFSIVSTVTDDGLTP